MYDKDAKVLADAARMLHMAARQIGKATKEDREDFFQPLISRAMANVAAAEARLKGYVYPITERSAG